MCILCYQFLIYGVIYGFLMFKVYGQRPLKAAASSIKSGASVEKPPFIAIVLSVHTAYFPSDPLSPYCNTNKTNMRLIPKDHIYSVYLLNKICQWHQKERGNNHLNIQFKGKNVTFQKTSELNSILLYWNK